MSNPARYNFTMVFGDTFNDVWTIKNSSGVAIDLSSATARMEINSAVDGSGTALLAVTSSDHMALAADGTITYSIPKASTAALSFSTGYYDCWVETGAGVRETILFGEVIGQVGIA